MWRSIRPSSKLRNSDPRCSHSSSRNEESFYLRSTLRLIVSVFLCNQKCEVSNVLQTSWTNRSSRLRQTLSTRATGNKALSSVHSILLCGCPNIHVSACLVQRRNKWICALKTALKECKVYGPTGDPAAAVPPSEYTLVPWEDVKASKALASPDTDAIPQTREPLIPRGEYQFSDRNQIVLDQGQDVWGETREVNMTAPKQTARPQPQERGRPTAEAAVAGYGGQYGWQAAPAGAAMAVAAFVAAERIIEPPSPSGGEVPT